jgi:HYDIN/CFA65/VesB-like, Ig-like domain
MIRILYTVIVGFILIGTNAGQAQIGFKVGGDSADVMQNFCLDPYGNIITVGSFSKTVNFNPSGSEFNLTSTGSTDNYIAKYSTNGSILWAVHFGGVGPDVANGVTTDAQGNIYVCGAYASQCDFDAGPGTDIHVPNGMTDAYVVKYNSSGMFVWATTFGGDSLETLYDIAHDGSNAVYVIGSYQDTMSVIANNPITKVVSQGKKDLIIVCYNDDGTFKWVSTMGDIDDDEGTAITINPGGNLYIGGYTTKPVIEPLRSTEGIYSGQLAGDILLGARTSTGEYLWTVRCGGEGHEQVAPGGIALDSYGDVYITGWFSDSVDFNPSSENAYKVSNGGFDVYMAKYSSTGEYISSMSFGGPLNDQAYGMGVDWQGDVFLTGCFRGVVDFDPGDGVRTLTSQGINGASDLFTAEYSSTGILFWANGFGSPVSGGENSSYGYAVVTDSLNNCYVAGKFFGTCDFDPSSNSLTFESNGMSDAFLVKYNHNGQIWGNTPVLDISSKTADFGNVPINTQSIAIREIYNSGDGILYVSSIISTSERFTVLEKPLYILPSESFELAMVFAPHTLGLNTAYIIIEHNGISQRDSIFVSGNGEGRAVSLTLPFISGWNMLSLPAQVEDGSTKTLFPDAISEAFAFHDGTYNTRDTFETTVGYWLKFENPVNVLIEGAARDSATMQVQQGWNMIGSVSSTVYVDSIEQQPPGIIGSSFFTYDGNYYETPTIEPGRAYWVKINSAGRLFLRGSELMSARNQIRH